MWKFACVFLLLVGGAMGQIDEECIAMATAETTPDDATADALSNAVAETLTKSVTCGENTTNLADPGEVGSLSVAVALAISEANTVGQECTSDADAIANFAAETVTQDLAGTILDGTADNPDAQRLAEAWLTARGPDVAAIVAEAPDFLSDDGCLDLTALSMGLPTAVELGEILSDAVGQIITAINCGTNLEPTEEECIWADRKFIGKCVGYTPAEPEPEPEAPLTRDECRKEFRECRKTDSETCSKDFVECFRNAAGCQFC